MTNWSTAIRQPTHGSHSSSNPRMTDPAGSASAYGYGSLNNDDSTLNSAWAASDHGYGSMSHETHQFELARGVFRPVGRVSSRRAAVLRV